MKILHISNTDVVGGRFNGFGMCSAISVPDIAEIGVWDRTTKNGKTHQIPPNNRFARYCINQGLCLSNRLNLDGLMGIGGWMLPQCDYFKRADVLHLHLIHNQTNLSVLSLPLLSRLRPMVWTIHDLWAITGGCEHAFDCERWKTGCAPRCPYPRRRALFKRYAPFLHWRLKRAVYRRMNVTLVVASQWMREKVAASPLLGRLPCHLIPFGVDLTVFSPSSKRNCRDKLGIACDHKVIAFRDVGLRKDRFKGIKWLMEALRIYAPRQPTTLLIFQDGAEFETLRDKYNIVRLGWVDGAELATAMSASDIFLMPSIQEAFGMMAVEAMACGVPVIVFEGTALPDVVKAPRGGLAVPARDAAELSGAVDRLLGDDGLCEQMGRQARLIAEREYSFALYVKRHLELYTEIAGDCPH